MKSTALVILTLNEIQGISALFDKIPFSFADESFVVDGGSTDGTVDFFRQRNIRVLEQNSKGRGEAFRIAASVSKCDNLIFFSPDGNENPGDIPLLINRINEGYDLAIASRFLPESVNEEDDKVFRWRAWANKAFTFIANVLWNKGTYITDTINGYRAIRKDAFLMLNLDATGFAIEYQMSIRAMKAGLKISEVPTIEGKRIGGESTAKSLPTGLLFLQLLWREIKTGKRFMSA